MAAWLNCLISLLWPPHCCGCRQAGTWWCGECAAAVRVSRNVRCPACESPSERGRYCPACKAATPLHGIVAGASLRGPLPSAIKALKYRHAKAVAPLLAGYPLAALRDVRNPRPNPAVAAMAPVGSSSSPVTSPPAPPAWLVPVPLHPQKRRLRGHNQAALIARAVATQAGLPLYDALQRVRHTPSQTGLGRTERQRNVEAAFRWSGPDLHGQLVYVVDDIATTGATLAACARVLKAAGAGEVWGLVIARREFAGRRLPPPGN